MKTHPLLLFFLFLFTQCHQPTEHLQQTQDSLYVLLHTQIYTLQQLPKFQNVQLNIPDSLSSTDSVMYLYLSSNYQNAIHTMDSIHFILNKSITEMDSLNHYRHIQDSAIILRLKYLTSVHHMYFQEYLKSVSIAEQNQQLIQHLLEHAHK